MNIIRIILILIRGFVNFSYYKKLSNDEPILIGGCGRSGTTLLLSILGAHPKIHSINRETGAFANPKLNRRTNFVTKLNISAELYKDRKKTATRYAEKTPKNINNLRNSFKFFNSKLKFIHIVRDGRDVVTSKHPSLKDEYWVSFERWVNDVSNGLEYSNNPNILIVKYEDLVNNFNETIKSIFDFLGLELVDEVYNYSKHTSVKYNNAWSSEVKKIHKTRSKLISNRDKERINSFMRNRKAVKLLKKLNYID
tara:strand:+ start:135 stop:893 length:759 start_codon:yes stop_codon:yes gene_type:complete